MIKLFLSKSFYALDILHDRVLLPFMSKIWLIEFQLRGGVTVGSCMFLGRPLIKFHPLSKVLLHNNSTFISNSRRCSSGNLYSPCRLQTHSRSSSIIIEENVGMNGTSIVSRSKTIFVGKNTMIAPNCVIMDSPHHRMWPPEDRLYYPDSGEDNDVIIEENCWIGTGVVILPGSHIGRNSVIGARSVVKGSIPQNCLAVGSPAKVIRILDSN